MKKHFIFISIFLTLLLTLFIIYRLFHRQPSWKTYYQEHANTPVRPLLLKAFNGLQPSVGTALDLGAGNGHETLYLLARGWKVFALDAEPLSKQLIEEKAEKENLKNKLTALATSFEKIDWQNLPSFDLIVASYSLPFVKAEVFYDLWEQVIDHLKPGGILIVNLFPQENKNFSASMKHSMTFLSQEQVDELLKPFFIHYFKKDNESFDIIAVKK